MRQIYEEFCNNGISKEDFNVKRSNFEKSLKVKLENVNTLLGMTHNTVLNGNKVTFKDILDQLMKLTLDDVNNAIRKHLKGRPSCMCSAAISRATTLACRTLGSI